jgi:4-amino-4-deoxy-L-arabinose transferase-like glycosyltransferase
MDVMWSWMPDSPEARSALLGALVGGLLTMVSTWVAEGMRLRAIARQEWRRVQDTDLREFQNAAVLAVHALDGDVKQAWDREISIADQVKPWGPVHSPAAFAVVEMLSTRLDNQRVKDAFAAVAESITDAHAELGKLPTPNPFVGLLSVRTSGDKHLTPRERLDQITFKTVTAQQRLTKLQEACADAYAKNRRSR